jgi:predicted DCC family thiol-disulfide oxidoreductase YuxK
MRVIYIDGNCNLCNGVIKHIYNHRPEGFLFGRISPLNNPEYVIYIKNGDRYNAELALRMIVKDMGGYYSVLSWALNIVPKRLLKYMYFFVSRNRYKVFGRKSLCELTSKIPESFKVEDFKSF